MEIPQEDLNKMVGEIYSKVQELRKEDKVLIQVDDEKFISSRIEDIIQQDTLGLLYDLNRLDEVQITLAKSKDEFPYLNFLVNNLAMTTILRYLHNRVKYLENIVKEIPQN